MVRRVEAHKVHDGIDGDFWVFGVYEGRALVYDSSPASYSTKADAIHEGRKHLAEGGDARSLKGKDWDA